MVSADRVMTSLPRDPRAATDARDWLAGYLDGRAGRAQANDALLVVSELATNAVQHGRGDVVLRAVVDEDRAIQLSVTDGSDRLPALQPVDPERIGGLGLRIVDQLASAWGVSPFPGGKTVWATIDRRR